MTRIERAQSGADIASKERIGRGEYIDFTSGYMKPEVPVEIKKIAALVERDEIDIGPIDKAGLMVYREAVAIDYKRRYGLTFDPEKQIYIAAGTTGVLTTMFSLFNGPENQLWEPDVGYVYKEIAGNVGLRNVSPYPLNQGVPDPEGIRDMLEQDKKANGKGSIVIVSNSPSNPTGKVISAETLQNLAEQIIESGRENVYVIEDNVYCRCVYERPHASIAAYYEQTLIADAPSKRGANLQNGFGIVPRDKFKEIINIRNTMGGVSAPRQYAAAVFLGGEHEDYIERKRAEMEGNRDVMAEELRQIPGVQFEVPEGGVYLYFTQEYATSEVFVAWAKRKCGVLLNDGIKYVASNDPNECKSARASFAASTQDEIREGVRRLKQAVAEFDPEEALVLLEQEKMENV